jgi:methylmalonyl-CoA mutase
MWIVYQTNDLEKEVEAKIKAIYKEKGELVLVYNGDLPAGNNGLGCTF